MTNDSKEIEKFYAPISELSIWIKDEISKSKDGRIKIITREFAISIGEELAKKSNMVIYWLTKYIYFRENIVVEKWEDSEEGKNLIRPPWLDKSELYVSPIILIFRMATEKDKFPEPSTRE